LKGNFNGVDDIYETTRIGITIKDHLNINVDGDCLDDAIEGFDTNRNGIIDGAEREATATPTDSDSDGLDDGYDDIQLGRLSGNSNATNGWSIDDFPNNHNPETTEKDWREAFADIGPVNVAVGVPSACPSEDLYDDLTTIFMPANIPAPINGTWTTPGTKDLAGIPAHLGTLDPTDNAYIDGNYIYTIPSLATGCPEQKITLNVTIDKKCQCPNIPAPSKISIDPTTCIDATTLPTLEVAPPPAGFEVRWSLITDTSTTPITRTDLTGNLATYKVIKGNLKAHLTPGQLQQTL